MRSSARTPSPSSRTRASDRGGPPGPTRGAASRSSGPCRAPALERRRRDPRVRRGRAPDCLRASARRAGGPPRRPSGADRWASLGMPPESGAPPRTEPGCPYGLAARGLSRRRRERAPARPRGPPHGGRAHGRRATRGAALGRRGRGVLPAQGAVARRHGRDHRRALAPDLSAETAAPSRECTALGRRLAALLPPASWPPLSAPHEEGCEVLAFRESAE